MALVVAGPVYLVGRDAGLAQGAEERQGVGRLPCRCGASARSPRVISPGARPTARSGRRRPRWACRSCRERAAWARSGRPGPDPSSPCDSACTSCRCRTSRARWPWEVLASRTSLRPRPGATTTRAALPPDGATRWEVPDYTSGPRRRPPSPALTQPSPVRKLRAHSLRVQAWICQGSYWRISQVNQAEIPFVHMAPSLSGRILIARPEFHDPNFDATLTLILEHSDEGGVGLVLNRPSPPAPCPTPSPSGRSWPACPTVVFDRRPGRPRRPDRPRPVGGLRRHAWCWALTRSTSTLSRRSSWPRASCRCGCSPATPAGPPGQLEGEIANHGWWVVDACIDDLFTDDPRQPLGPGPPASGRRAGLVRPLPPGPLPQLSRPALITNGRRAGRRSPA